MSSALGSVPLEPSSPLRFLPSDVWLFFSLLLSLSFFFFLVFFFLSLEDLSSVLSLDLSFAFLFFLALPSDEEDLDLLCWFSLPFLRSGESDERDDEDEFEELDDDEDEDRFRRGLLFLDE